MVLLQAIVYTCVNMCLLWHIPDVWFTFMHFILLHMQSLDLPPPLPSLCVRFQNYKKQNARGINMLVNTRNER